MFTLKPISHDSVEGALAKAERYRLLNEPHEAESICRDILEIDPANREARISLILALTDEFPREEGVFSSAMEAIAGLQAAYDRAYYSGIAWERRAKAYHDAGKLGSSGYVYDWIVKALQLFEEAEHLRPTGNDDAILRWNACVRFLERHKKLGPKTEDVKEPILSE
jgi:tetratricopeptide (TPR) repeat protein